MRIVWVIVLAALMGCEQSEREPEVVLPRVPPDTVIVSWSVVSRSTARESVHAVLEASRKLTTTTRTADGTMMSTSRTVSTKEYASVVRALRSLDCCSLQSTTAERPDPYESKPLLEIDLGDVRCEVELWDREWREGLARKCGLAAAGLHRSGFVPDIPVDDSAP